MAHNDNIGRELRSISEVVAGLPGNTPFTVPPHFFEQFPEKMLEAIRHSAEGQEEDASGILAGLKDRSTFQVPAGYFDQLPVNLMKRILLEEEAENSLEEEEILPAILTGLRDLPTFRIPAGYFDTLPEQLAVQAIASDNNMGVEEELRRLSPFMASMSREYPGKVPEGYFDLFPWEAEPGQWESEPAKVIPISRTLPLRKFLAAAVMVGVLMASAISGFHIYDSPSDFLRSGVNLKTKAQFNTALARISDQDILDYLKSNTDVSDADLIASEVDEQQLPKIEDNADGTHPAELTPAEISGENKNTAQ